MNIDLKNENEYISDLQILLVGEFHRAVQAIYLAQM